MDGVKAFRLGLRQVHHACTHHPQARLLEATIHLADQVPGDAVRLDDGKSALDGHDDLG